MGGILQWNRPLLLSLGKPGFPLLVAALVGIPELVLIYWFVPRYGHLAMAGILSAYFIVTSVIVAERGLTILHRHSTGGQPA